MNAHREIARCYAARAVGYVAASIHAGRRGWYGDCATLEAAGDYCAAARRELAEAGPGGDPTGAVRAVLAMVEEQAARRR